MSSDNGLYEIFAHVEELKSREPEYFVCEKPIRIAFGPDNLPCEINDQEDGGSNRGEESNNNLVTKEKPIVSSPVLSLEDGKSLAVVCAKIFSDEESTKTANFKIQKNAVSLLQEGCMRHYDGVSPKYVEDDRLVPPGTFAIRCEIREMKAVGIGTTIKAAKQSAAREILKMIVKKGRHKDFCLGDNEEEAFNLLDRLEEQALDPGPVKNANLDTIHQENFVGKLNSMCQQNRWFAPRFDFDSEGPPNSRIFTAKCQLGNLESVSQGRTKKLAKTFAAWEMWRIINGCTEEELKKQGLEFKKPVEFAKPKERDLVIGVKKTTDVAVGASREAGENLTGTNEVGSSVGTLGNTNRNCGDFLFAKEVRTFAESLRSMALVEVSKQAKVNDIEKDEHEEDGQQKIIGSRKSDENLDVDKGFI